MPAAVRRLAALGVKPDGHPLRGIRYVDERHHADARFRRGAGLGVRRTVLHAALAERAAALGIPVLPTRVTAFEQCHSHVIAAGTEASYLVAADGLHSTIRRTLEGGRATRERGPTAPRYGLRRHYRVAPWTDLVEVHLTARAEAYVTPVSPDVVGIALLLPRLGADGFEARLSAFPALSRQAGRRGMRQRGARGRADAAVRTTARPRPGAACRRRLGLPGRADRRGPGRRLGPGGGTGPMPGGRQARRLRAGLATRSPPRRGG